jgi:hypothetical protein
LDSTGSGQGPVVGCCECGDEPSGSCATELVNDLLCPRLRFENVVGNSVTMSKEGCTAFSRSLSLPITVDLIVRSIK